MLLTIKLLIYINPGGPKGIIQIDSCFVKRITNIFLFSLKNLTNNSQLV
jgi:hypothetical protein